MDGWHDYMLQVAYNCHDKDLESLTDIGLAYLLVVCRDELQSLRARQNPVSDEYDPDDEHDEIPVFISRVESARDRCELTVKHRLCSEG
jgi:hypothetical protein